MNKWAIACSAFVLGFGCAAAALAQRVQIPSQPVQPFVQQPNTTFAPPGSIPAGTFTAPSLPPVSGAPVYSQAPIGPPPAFDAYQSPSVSGTIGPPPASVPYTYQQSPQARFPQQTFPQQVFPQQPAGPQPGVFQGYPQSGGPFGAGGYAAPAQRGGLFTDGLPFDWQSGTYGYQSDGGNLVRFQKFLQRIGMEYSWLASDEGLNDFEVSRAEFAATFAIPVMHNIESPLLVTPGFAFNWFEGPVGDPDPPVAVPAIPRGPDLPPRVYDAYLDLSWYPRPFEWFGAELGVRTGVWTDFDELNSDSVRILGRGLGVISVTPNMDILIGAVYLDRLRAKVLPAGGIHFRPNQDWDLYVVFPNPKLRRRFRSLGNTEWWWYVAGEYGGGSWTVDRVGLGDRIDYNDIRVLLGLEYETPTHVRGHMEVGFVFDREILFASTTPAKVTPDDTVMLRAGIDF